MNKLRAIKKDLKNFFCYFKDDSILAISEDKIQLPFAFLILDPAHPKELLLSLAVDYPTSVNAVSIALTAGKRGQVSLTQPFYISMTNGDTYLGTEALDRWDMESINMELVEPLNKERH